jgi:hypothetical protein
MYVGDVRLGPDHRSIGEAGEGFPFVVLFSSRCCRQVAVGSVGDGETGRVSLYTVGNLNKLVILLYSIRFCYLVN